VQAILRKEGNLRWEKFWNRWVYIYPELEERGDELHVLTNRTRTSAVTESRPTADHRINSQLPNSEDDQ